MLLPLTAVLSRSPYSYDVLCDHNQNEPFLKQHLEAFQTAFKNVAHSPGLSQHPMTLHNHLVVSVVNPASQTVVANSKH